MKSNYLFGILIFIASWCCCMKINAQSRVYKHYTVEDGLPSSEVYSAFQDSKGYMWFATDAGVSRFNGYEFENFDESAGLTDNTVFLFYEDHKGRIWFGTFNCQLSYYENGRIYPFQYNDVIVEKLQSKSAMTSFYVDSNSTIWIGFYNEGLYKITSNGKVSCELLKQDNSFLKIQLFNSDNFVAGYCKGEKHEKIASKQLSYTYSFMTEIKKAGHIYNYEIPIQVNLKKYPYTTVCMAQWRGNFFYYNSLKSYLMTVNSPSRIYEIKTPALLMESRVLTVYSDKSFLWFCVQGKGVYKCVIEDNEILIKDHFLNEESVSRVFKDRERGVWFQTLKKGVYYLPSEEIKYNSEEDNSIIEIEVDTLSGGLYLVYEDGKIFKRNQTENKLKEIILLNSKYIPQTLEYNYTSNSLLVGGGEKSFCYYKDTQFYYFKDVKYYDITRSFLVDSNIIYQANSYGVSIIKDNREIYNSFKQGEPKMWCSSLVKNNDKIWIGTNQGIKVYDKGKIKSPFTHNKYLSTGITNMERLNKELFLIGTKSYGMLVVQNDSVIDIIDKKDGLVSNIIRKIHVDSQDEIWVGTSKGLSRINYKGINDFQIENLTPYHGLPSEEIIDVCSYRNTIYAATPKGLVEFDKTKISFNKKPPNVYIKQFNVNNESRDPENIELTYQENFINIKYEGLNYRSLGEVEYQYRMLGVDTNWVTTTSRLVQYPTLQPNNYVFEVKAKNENGIWSQPATLSFTISPPFWLTWWFISLEIVLGLLIIYLVFRYREKQLLQKSNIEKRMIELELKALRSQMNPHFIFNTLNSIQHYIVGNDFRSTNKYLSKFAKLIRTVLNLSEKNRITIQEEVDMLILYMDLERMRFEDGFDYEIIVDEEIDPDYDEIPSMLIQPYVENAIWHGLMNKTEKGIIKVGIILRDNYLCCTISDNGIGREKAIEIKSKRNIKRKSVGMTITKERLDLINNNEINVDIVDLKDEDGNATGTEVNIKIPFKNEDTW
ncbi:MAG: histidine kinase [Vicingus serpentipes]|nr:histidine kinase [Vicingus serpentipes]